MHRTHARLFQRITRQSSQTGNQMNQFLRRGLLAWLLFCVFSLIPFVLQASHLLGGHLTWASTDSIPNQVQFKFIAVFELAEVESLFAQQNSVLFESQGRSLKEGNIFSDKTGDIKLFFGDDSSKFVTYFRVIDSDSADADWVRCIAIDADNKPDSTLLHTYPAATDTSNKGGPWKATIDGCCRIDGLENADDNDRFIMSTFVVAASGNKSPVPLRVPFIRLPEGGARSFRIPVSEGDFNLSWRLAGSNEGAIRRQSINSKNNDDLKVDSQGLLTWNTGSLDIGDLWTAQLIIQDRKTSIEVPFDFTIKITENQDPACDAPSRKTVRLGETLNFTVMVSDADSSSGDEVSLSVNGLPDSAKMNPSLPATGNPISSTFFWAPTRDDLGEHMVTFNVVDTTGARKSCITKIVVEDTLCTIEIVSPQDGATVCDDSLQVTASVKTSSGFNVVPGQCTINDIIANVIDDTLFAKIPIDFGLNTIKVQCVLQDTAGIQTTCSETITVNRNGDPKCFVTMIARVGSGGTVADSLTVAWTTEVEGGTLPYQITCSINGESVSKTANSFKTSFSATVPLFAGDNSIVVTCTVVDSCGRVAVCQDSMLFKGPPLADAGPDTSICFGDSVQIGGSPTGSGGTGLLSFQWTPNGLNSLTLPNPIAKPNMTTLYVVTVTDSTGQSDSDTVTVTVHPNPVVDVGPSPNLSPGQSWQLGGSPTVEGGMEPYTIIWSPAATLNNPAHENPIAKPDSTTTYVLKVTDANGCMASDSVEVEILPIDSCEVEIRYPMDGELVCNDSVKVIAYFGLSGSEGLVCTINGFFARVDDDGQFIVTVPLQLGDNEIIARCVRVDSNNVEANSCADTISVFSDITPPVCEIDSTNFPMLTGIISDLETGIVRIEVVEISNSLLKIAGFEVTEPDTFEFAAEDSVGFVIEKIDVTQAGSFTLRGFNAAGCEVFCGLQDSIPPPDTCNVEIRYPMDGEFICDDSVKVKVNFEATTDRDVICEINGLPAERDAYGFLAATVPLQPGDNQIIAQCVIVDSNGVAVAVCVDTISVFSDPTPPVCELDYNNYPDINGKITDNESGIVLFEVLDLGNRILLMNNVEIAPGEAVEFDGETEITFVLKKIDVNATGSFDLNMVNGAGCAIMCDPIDLTLRSEGPSSNFSFALPQRDRWLYVENHGLTRIEFVVNEMLFNLKATGGLANEANSYAIPGYGTVGFDLKYVLKPGENNFRLNCEGPSGSYANIIIADYLRSDVGEPETIEFQEVVIPKEFALMQNHPNPFNPSTNIRFNIPDNFTDGIQVHLRIYNLMGQLVKTLVDEQRFPGEYTARWDGRDQRNESVSSGIYIYQLVAGEFKMTKRMLFLK